MDPSKAIADSLAAVLIFNLIIFGLGMCYFVFWVYSIYHCLTKGPEKERALWILVICLVPLFGAIFYHAIGKKSATPPAVPSSTPPRIIPLVPSVVNAHTTAVLDAASLTDERERARAISRALSQQPKNRRGP